MNNIYLENDFCYSGKHFCGENLTLNWIRQLPLLIVMPQN